MMRILISNDDGIYSPGIVALAKAARRFGEVRIVAPDVEQSSMGHAITASRPLRLKRIHLDSFEAHRVNGTPADCVALGMHRWGHVDVVLSGINLGLNLGNSCWHSGTLAAAKQAALLGARGIAFSTNVDNSREPDFAALEPFVIRVLDLLLGMKTLSLVNVNLPEKPKGIRWTRQSVRHYDGKVVPDKDPAGRPIFWFTVTPLQGAAKGTDRWAVEHHWVSITPLRLDLTDEADLARALALSAVPAAKVSRKTRRSARAPGRKRKAH
ncbi:MAG TPA: 5'/3'-nucleotidase SurE [Candidatus Udaeobacter sp.]|jgi:5'-nucleotidase